MWRSATTLPELGALVARWLGGDLASRPGYQPRYGPDDETAALVPALAAANRAGLVTHGSQPGHGPKVGWDGVLYAQRPAVDGHVDDPQLLRRLVDAADRAGLHIVIHDEPGQDDAGTVPVTTRDGQTVTAFGGRLDHSDLHMIWDTCSPAAIAAVTSAAQVTLIDPEYAPNTRLWDVLQDVAAGEPGPNDED